MASDTNRKGIRTLKTKGLSVDRHALQLIREAIGDLYEIADHNETSDCFRLVTLGEIKGILNMAGIEINEETMPPEEDLMPVIHGRWLLYTEGRAKCSRCGILFSDVWDADHTDHWCRNCGALMDLQSEKSADF